MKISKLPSYLVYVLLVLAIGLATVAIDRLQWFKRLDNLLYDMMLSADQRLPVSNIAIIAIDEKSIDQLGLWPWPRNIHTRLLERLSLVDHPATGIDIMFSEPANAPVLDQGLAEVMRKHGRVILPVVPVTDYDSGAVRERLPVAILEEAAARLGSVDAELDEDGISRSIYLLSGEGAPVWPSFPLAMLSLDEPDIESRLPGARNPDLAGFHPGKWVRDYHVRVPFTGPSGHYPSYSYIDVLEGRVQASDLAGKYLLVGVTASGIGDRLPTPTTGHSYQMPGVEYMANILDALLTGRLINSVRVSYRATFTLLAVMIPLLLYPLWAVRLTPVIWVVACVSILMATSSLLQHQFWLPPAAPLMTTLLAFPVWAWWRLKRSSKLLDEVEEKRTAAMDAVDHGVVILDTARHIEFMNSLAEQLTGTRLQDAVNQSLQAIFPDIEVDTKHESTSANRLSLPQELVINDSEGNRNKLYIHTNSFRDRWGNERGSVINLALDPASLASRSKASADHPFDRLTGLYNRTAIAEHISEVVRQEVPAGELHILNIDIDNLALITSSRTHEFADRVLLEYVTRLQAVLSQDNALGRIGSDQLILLLGDKTHDDARNAATEIISQAKQPILIDEEQVILAVNIGISHYPTDGDDAETLLKHASYAIRQNESMARSRYKFYSRRDHEISMQDHSMEQGLRQSIIDDTLELFYQPQVDLMTGVLVGFEALLRWRGQDGQFVSTDKAITIAEQSELIHQLGRWVVNAACQQLYQWKQDGFAINRLAINLSPADLERPDFLDYTSSAIRSRGFVPSQIEFEITEHSVLKHTDLSMQVLNSFRKMGAHLAIDDFGTGYSTFNYLKALPVGTVKIDKSFVQDMVEIEDDAFIVQSMISMAHGLGINVVAEGIETDSQVKMLIQQGCDVIQGYLVSRPMSAKDISRWLTEACRKEADEFYLEAHAAWLGNE